MSAYSNDRVGMRARPSPFKSARPPVSSDSAPTPPLSAAAAAAAHDEVELVDASQPQAHRTPRRRGRERERNNDSDRSSTPSPLGPPPPSAYGIAACTATPAPPISRLSSFLLSPVYHAFERELRADTNVDLSRRSGGGVGRDRIGRSRGRRPAATPTASTSGHLAAAAGRTHPVAPVAPVMHSHPEEEQEKDERGDFAIVVRIESKLLKQRIPIHAMSTQPPSSESSTIQPMSVPPLDDSSAEPSTTSTSIDADATHTDTTGGIAYVTRRVTALTPALLSESPRLRTVCARLSHAGLKFVSEPRIVNRCALLKVFAPNEVLEKAAFRLRLKMPIKPDAEVRDARVVPGVHDAPAHVDPHATTRMGLDSNTTATASSSSISVSTPAGVIATAEPWYTFLPFDPAIRDQFLGTPDPSCLFRSSERQILIDHLLRSSRADGGAGLGEQAVNDLEYRRRTKAKRKERAKRAKEGGPAASGTRRTSVVKEAPIGSGPGVMPASDEADGQQPVMSESDDGLDLEASSSEDDSPYHGGGFARDGSDADAVPYIERYIRDRFPLHSSRLDALDSWISYWRLRKRLGARAWLAGLFVQPTDAISSYFGNEVAFYYSFINFYACSMLVPAAVGLVLLVMQLSVSSVDSPMLPAFSLFFAIWSSVLLEVWKRRQSSLSWRWGSFDYESEDETPRPEFEGVVRRDPLTGEEARVYPPCKRAGKIALSALAWIAILIGFSALIIVFFTKWADYVDSITVISTGSSYVSLNTLLVPCLWGVFIPFLDLAFNRLARRLTEWENWRLGSTFRALFTTKVFTFRFLNAFLALYYYMLADNAEAALKKLNTSVASFMIVSQLINFALAVVWPYVKQRWNNWRVQRRRAADQAECERSDAAVTPSVVEEEEEELSQAWLESTYPEYDHFEEYANLAIQFGYVCFFSAAFPLAPMCALVASLVQIRVGAYQLCRLTRRPLACKTSGLGIWLPVLQVMSVIAVLTNCALIGLTSTQIESWFPGITNSTKILLIFAFEHAILVLKVVITFAIPNVTTEVDRQRKKEKLAFTQANTELLELRRKQYLQHLGAGDATTDAFYAINI